MLQTICNLIILIGGVVGAIAGIIAFISKYFGKTFKFFKKRQDERFKQQLKEFLPEALVSEEIRVKRDMKEYHEKDQENFYKEIMDRITPILNEIKLLNLEQNKKIEILSKSSKDVLREKIMAIYHQNKKNHSMMLHEREALDQYYKDYKAEDGNSYIDKYYSRMSKWETIDIDECDCEKSEI